MSKHLETQVLLAPARQPLPIAVQTVGDVSVQVEELHARDSSDVTTKKELEESTRLTESAFLYW
jgi:hypothetical protein